MSSAEIFTQHFFLFFFILEMSFYGPVNQLSSYWAGQFT